MRRRWSPWRLYLLCIALVLGAVMLVTLLDLRAAYTALRSARDRLQAIAHDPEGIATPQGRAAMSRQIDSAISDVTNARRRVMRSPLIVAADVVPGLSTQRAALITVINDVRAGARVGRELLDRVDELAARMELRDGAIPIDGLKELDAQARHSAVQLAGLVRGDSGLWRPVARVRERFDAAARDGAQRLEKGATTLRTVLSFLGADGDRRYLIAMQNNAEMRDQGAVLSYAVARFSSGRTTFERSGAIHDLTLDRPTATPIPPGTQEVFGFVNLTQQWLNVNATADFSLSGRAMVDMYGQATGERIDGVIAVDVPGLAALLRTVGPIEVEGVPEPLTADNAGRILLHDLYEGLEATSDQTVRKEKLAEATQAVISRLTTGSQPAVTLGRELGKAAAGGHLKLFSTNSVEEQVFEQAGLAGGPAVTAPDRTFHIAVQNRTPTKLDYYIKPKVTQTVRLEADGSARVITKVAVENQAPVGAAPSYALGPNGENQKNPGDYLAWVLLWAPAGSIAQEGVVESGLNLSQRQFEVPAGETREVEFETVIPRAVRDGRLELRLVPQPRLEPVPLEVRLTGGGGATVSGARVFRGPWDSIQRFSWTVSR